MDPAKAEKTRVMLAELWQRSLPTMLARIEGVEAAAAAAQSGPIPPEIREHALSSAHKLAGSLGMFGYLDGTYLAREIEILLESPNPSSENLARLAVALRASVFPPT